MLTMQQQEEGGRKVTNTKLNNVIMQMRNNCNHPGLVSSAFSDDMMYPASHELLEQAGKLQLLDRLLKKLKAKGHRVLIFSQVTAISVPTPPLPLPYFPNLPKATLESLCWLQCKSIGQKGRRTASPLAFSRAGQKWFDTDLDNQFVFEICST